MEDIKLTQYSHGAGCGCKISPKVLDEILSDQRSGFTDKNLLVGNSTKDDAAVYAIDDKTCIISTTDFFMPIVDDPYDFGAIAATNAISDIYAMGGKPLFALNLCCFPGVGIPDGTFTRILEGAAGALQEASAALLGGHTMRDAELKYGLAVIGRADPEHVLTNAGARPGHRLLLTKPLGTGVLINA